MAKWLKDNCSLSGRVRWHLTPAVHEGEIQGGHKEAFLKNFPTPSIHPENSSGAQSKADDTVLLENLTGPLSEWDTVSAPTNIFAIPVLSTGEDAEPTLRDITAVVTNCNSLITALTDEIKEVKAEVSFICHYMQKLHERTSALKGCVSTVEDNKAPLMRDVKHNVILTAQHVENRMSRLRRKNLVAFIENWLLTVFDKDSFFPIISVKRAHRVPACPLPSGNPPHTFLFKLLNYKDRDAVLAKAKSMGALLAIDNAKVSLFLDYSAELQKQGKFMKVTRHLQ